jgi:predicted dehydrogenase
LAKQILEAGKSVVIDKPMAITSAQIGELIQLAAAKGVYLIPFHNRRWDSDFQTLFKLIREDSVGRIVHLESTMDRWRPAPVGRAAWKEETEQGGLLLDIGTHLADQAICLFGKPQAVHADITRERDGDGSNDSFTVRLRYAEFSFTLSANVLSSLPRPRYHMRGTKGNYCKWGLDPQEAALNKITRIDDPAWGKEAQQNWGTFNSDVDGCVVTCPVPPVPGDYRLFYAAVRDALLRKSQAPVSAQSAWRVARLLEWAVQSSTERREVACDWGEEP